MVIKKRMLLWDYTNTNSFPQQLDQVPLDDDHPTSSVSNWNAWVPPELKGRAPFRPMIHLMEETQGDKWQWILNSDQPLVLYFNEPERNGISPQQAADIWHNQVLELRRRGKQLCSPSPAWTDEGRSWLEQFMALVADSPPDYLGLHAYNTDAGATMRYLEEMHQRYGLPIIVHEIASVSRSYDEVLAFTVEMANWMDSKDFVYEYAFFGCMGHVADDFVSPEAQLMNPDGSFKDLMYKLMFDQPMHV